MDHETVTKLIFAALWVRRQLSAQVEEDFRSSFWYGVEYRQYWRETEADQVRQETESALAQLLSDQNSGCPLQGLGEENPHHLTPGTLGVPIVALDLIQNAQAATENHPRPWPFRKPGDDFIFSHKIRKSSAYKRRRGRRGFFARPASLSAEAQPACVDSP